jgi:uncharacterized phage-associated protein
MQHSSLAIANEFLVRAEAQNRRLTQMQLQKLVYLAHGWSLAFLGNALIEDDIEAWDYGPVIRRLYDATKRYGSGPVTRHIRWGDDTPFFSEDGGEAFEPLTAQERELIDAVWKAYGDLPAFQLSALTHAPNSPWSSAYQKGMNRTVSPERIGEYFRGLAARGEPQPA